MKMKLHNKKTEEIVDVYNIYISKRVEDDSLTSHENVIRSFGSIAELNEEWEDYQPTEPLIKDDKIRKAVRAWAEANNYPFVKVGYDMASEPNNGNVQIHFEGSHIVDEDKYGIHAITELCGEEEE